VEHPLPAPIVEDIPPDHADFRPSDSGQVKVSAMCFEPVPKMLSETVNVGSYIDPFQLNVLVGPVLDDRGYQVPAITVFNDEFTFLENASADLVIHHPPQPDGTGIPDQQVPARRIRAYVPRLPLTIDIWMDRYGDADLITSQHLRLNADLSTVSQDEGSITIDLDLRTEELFAAGNVDVVDPSRQYLKISSPVEVLPNRWRNLRWWRPREFSYPVTVENTSDDKTIVITALILADEGKKLQLTESLVSRPPSYYGGQVLELRDSVAKLGDDADEATDALRPLADALGEPTWNLDRVDQERAAGLITGVVERVLGEHPAETRDVYVAIPLVIYRDFVGFAFLSPGEHVTFEFVVQENERYDASGVTPLFILPYIAVEQVVQVHEWPIYEHWVNLAWAYEQDKISIHSYGTATSDDEDVLVDPIP
jgi:hypothetical protein